MYDVLIIGAGPAGLSAAIYTGRARLNTLVLEKGIPGGQILLTDFIENYPGFADGVAPFELMESFRKQAEKFGAKIFMKEATEIRKKGKFWVVSDGKDEYSTKVIIIAMGATHRKLGVSGEKELIGKGISYCATCDGAFFREKNTAVVGGGSLALTEALFLTKFCSSVKIIHRRKQFRAEKILQERVKKNKKMSLILDAVVEKISGNEKLESVTLRNVTDNSLRDLKLDGLFIGIGMVPNSDLVKDLVGLNEWQQIKVNKTMETSCPGIFAVGDITDSCPEQVATASGSGVAAAIAADEYIQELQT